MRCTCESDNPRGEGFAPIVGLRLLERVRDAAPHEPGEDFCGDCESRARSSTGARKSLSAPIRVAGHLSPRISKASARRSPPCSLTSRAQLNSKQDLEKRRATIDGRSIPVRVTIAVNVFVEQNCQ